MKINDLIRKYSNGLENIKIEISRLKILKEKYLDLRDKYSFDTVNEQLIKQTIIERFHINLLKDLDVVSLTSVGDKE